MASVPSRVYEPWFEKHKAPRGFGTHCPSELDPSHAQELLERAVRLEGDTRLYCVAGDWVFVGHEHRPGRWHGFPKPGNEVHHDVLQGLLARGHISRRQKRRLIRQRGLPPRYPWPDDTHGT